MWRKDGRGSCCLKRTCENLMWTEVNIIKMGQKKKYQFTARFHHGVRSYHSCLVMSDSQWLRGLRPPRLLCPWDFPDKNTGVGCHFLLQESFMTQGSNPRLLHWQVDSLPLNFHTLSFTIWKANCFMSTELKTWGARSSSAASATTCAARQCAPSFVLTTWPQWAPRAHIYRNAPGWRKGWTT